MKKVFEIAWSDNIDEELNEIIVQYVLNKYFERPWYKVKEIEEG